MQLHSYGFGSPNIATSLGCSPGYRWWTDSIPEIFSRGRSTSLKERTTIVSCAIRMSKKQLFTFSSHALLVRLVGSTLVFSGTLWWISSICCCMWRRGSQTLFSWKFLSSVLGKFGSIETTSFLVEANHPSLLGKQVSWMKLAYKFTGSLKTSALPSFLG